MHAVLLIKHIRGNRWGPHTGLDFYHAWFCDYSLNSVIASFALFPLQTHIQTMLSETGKGTAHVDLPMKKFQFARIEITQYSSLVWSIDRLYAFDTIFEWM